MKRPGWQEQRADPPGSGSPLWPWVWAVLGLVLWLGVQPWLPARDLVPSPLDVALDRLADGHTGRVIWIGDSRLRHALPAGPVLRSAARDSWPSTGPAGVPRMRRLTVPWLEAEALSQHLDRLLAQAPVLVVLQLEVLLPGPFHPARRDPADFEQRLDLEGGDQAQARVQRLWADTRFTSSPAHEADGVRLLDQLATAGVPVVVLQLPQSATVQGLAAPGYADAQTQAARDLFDAPIARPLAVAPDAWFKDHLHMNADGAAAYVPLVLAAVAERRP